MTDRELMQQMVNAWEDGNEPGIVNAIEDIRVRLAQPEPEPVACPYCHNSHTLGAVYFDQNCAGCVKRMTAPPHREWHGLTDEEAKKVFNDEHCNISAELAGILARAIEAKLKEKNHAD